MKVGDVDIPEFDEDPALLSAMFLGYAQQEQWRKVVLATCRELVRAGAATAGRRLSEARIDDLARMHRSYLEFLEKSLRARVQFERNVKDSGAYQ